MMVVNEDEEAMTEVEEKATALADRRGTRLIVADETIHPHPRLTVAAGGVVTGVSDRSPRTAAPPDAAILTSQGHHLAHLLLTIGEHGLLCDGCAFCGPRSDRHPSASGIPSVSLALFPTYEALPFIFYRCLQTEAVWKDFGNRTLMVSDAVLCLL